jgi:hypothetical protein
MVRIDAEFVMSNVGGVTALRDPPPLGVSSWPLHKDCIVPDFYGLQDAY